MDLCGAHLLAQLLHHVCQVFHLSVNSVFAWIECFKTYVGNQISHIVELIPPSRWNHVSGVDYPADCTSRGLLPSKLLDHELWWDGLAWLKSPPSYWPQQQNIYYTEISDEIQQICHYAVGDGLAWLKSPPSYWPQQQNIYYTEISDEIQQICHYAVADLTTPIIRFDRCCSYSLLRCVTAWIFRFIKNCNNQENRKGLSPHLTTEELIKTDNYWISLPHRRIIFLTKTTPALLSLVLYSCCIHS